MEIGILGPLEVRADGGAVDLGTPKARVVLAALVLRHGEVLSADHLIEAAWPAGLPANPRAALQTNVARVRRVLTATGDATRLETLPDGYRLRLEPGELDADRFETMTARARQHLASGDAGGAAAELRAALRLWRGPVLGDLGDLEFATSERARLDELRLDATEDRIDAELLLGRHRELVPELETLAAAHPLREGLWARLAVALYRADRPTDALERVHQLAAYLGEQLGLQPSAAVEALEQQLLVHGPELDAGPWDRAGERAAPGVDHRVPSGTATATATADATATVDATGGPVPAAAPGAAGATGHPPPLPDVVAHHRATPMVGRVDVLERLGALIGSGEAGAWNPAPIRIAVVTGEPGIGKTRVAAEAAATAHAAGAVVLMGRCDPDPLLPALPVAEILDQVLDAAELGLVDSLGSRAGELGRLLPDIGTRLPSVGPPTDAPGEAAGYLLARAVGDALGAVAAGHPLVLLVDDLHWADQLSIDLIRHLTTSGELPPGTTLVLTRRPDPSGRLDELMAALSRAAPLTEVALAGLSAEETSALVAAEVAGRTSGTAGTSGRMPVDVSPWLGRSVHAHTGGNPYFSLELARHLAGRDAAEVPAAADLPLGVVAVIEHRIAELE